MLISQKSTALLRRRMNSSRETFCSGLFLSARWFVISQTAEKGTHLIVLPNREAAEYCSADLYNLVEGDSVIYAPHVLFQTSHGHSSDAHFIYNTGLLPLLDGVVAVNWATLNGAITNLPWVSSGRLPSEK